MSFNGEMFNANKTKATDAKLKSLSRNMKRLVRKNGPLRGFAVKGRDNPVLAVKGLNDLTEKLFDYIKTTHDLNDSQREHFLVWEEFQADQKGPTGPITQDVIQVKALDPILHPEKISVDTNDLDVVFHIQRSLSRYYENYVKVDITKLNYEQSGRELPNDTVRGFPYHSIGRDVDEEIISEVGSSCEAALSFFERSSQLVCFPGWRIQGKPYPGPAKVRIVMIPCVFYQYLMVGIVDEFMRQLKQVPSFAGWRDPETRDRIILNMLDTAERDGYAIIQLDFSEYDKHFGQWLRLSLGDNVGGPLMVDNKEKERFIAHLHNYLSNEFIFLGSFERLPSGRDGQLCSLPNQLVSGVKNTQSDGSAGNGTIQGFAVKDAFGQDPRGDLTLYLGDDAGIAIKKSILTEYGYTGVLERLAKSFAKLGFKLNPTKAYPNEDLAFLQKLYVPKDNIKGCGTGARSLASFLFKEKYPQKIPGIKSLAALDIVSQITILNNAYALQGVDLSGFSQTVADAGLEEDEGLRYLIQEFKKTNGTAHDFFKYLIKVSGVGIDGILNYMDAKSYDHTGLSQKLQSKDYGDVFKILKYLLNSEVSQKAVRVDVQALFDDSNVVVDGVTNEDIIDED